MKSQPTHTSADTWYPHLLEGRGDCARPAQQQPAHYNTWGAGLRSGGRCLSLKTPSVLHDVIIIRWYQSIKKVPHCPHDVNVLFVLCICLQTCACLDKEMTEVISIKTNKSFKGYFLHFATIFLKGKKAQISSMLFMQLVYVCTDAG